MTLLQIWKVVNQMSNIEELICEKCQQDVTYKKISDICDIARGKVISKDYIRENLGDYPVYSSQTENKGELGRISTYMYEGEYLTWTTDGANAGTVFYRNGKFSITNVCGILKIQQENIAIKYLYYVLGFVAPKYVNEGMGNAKLMSNVMANIEVPVPPLNIQLEIVNVMDNLTGLERELVLKLTNELSERKKQYEYYRNEMLTFGEDIERKKISDIYTRVKGTPITAGKMKEIENPNGGIRIFAGGKTVINANESDIPNANITRVPAVLVQSRGVIDFIFYDKPFTFKNEMWAYTADEVYSLKFLYYLLKNDIEHFREEASGMGALPQISLPATQDYEIPVPPLEIQKQIVDKLEVFSDIYTNIQRELSEEIDRRHKQYLYYKERLLSFERYGD